MMTTSSKRKADVEKLEKLDWAEISSVLAALDAYIRAHGRVAGMVRQARADEDSPLAARREGSDNAPRSAGCADDLKNRAQLDCKFC
jgi:hypothetical protein